MFDCSDPSSDLLARPGKRRRRAMIRTNPFILLVTVMGNLMGGRMRKLLVTKNIVRGTFGEGKRSAEILFLGLKSGGSRGKFTPD